MGYTRHMPYNAHAMISKEALIKYLHQVIFSPPKQTILKAIGNKQFSTWTGFMAQAVQKYLPDLAPAIYKGHMKRQKQVLRSAEEGKNSTRHTQDQQRSSPTNHNR